MFVSLLYFEFLLPNSSNNFLDAVKWLKLYQRELISYMCPKSVKFLLWEVVSDINSSFDNCDLGGLNKVIISKYIDFDDAISYPRPIIARHPNDNPNYNFVVIIITYKKMFVEFLKSIPIVFKARHVGA